MKRIHSLFLLIAAIGLISFTGYASSNFDMIPGFNYYYGGAFGGFGGGMGMAPVSFVSMDFGAFNHFNGFGGGFGSGFGGGFGGMTLGMGYGPGMFPGYMDAFEGFGMDFGRQNVRAGSGHKIVPIPAVASATTSITFDESGEIHVRPFDDEDLFVED